MCIGFLIGLMDLDIHVVLDRLMDLDVHKVLDQSWVFRLIAVSMIHVISA